MTFVMTFSLSPKYVHDTAICKMVVAARGRVKTRVRTPPGFLQTILDSK